MADEMHDAAVAALRKIEKMEHRGCYGCPACLAHWVLFGHWPNQAPRCCFDAAREHASGGRAAR